MYHHLLAYCSHPHTARSPPAPQRVPPTPRSPPDTASDPARRVPRPRVQPLPHQSCPALRKRPLRFPPSAHRAGHRSSPAREKAAYLPPQYPRFLTECNYHRLPPPAPYRPHQRFRSHPRPAPPHPLAPQAPPEPPHSAIHPMPPADPRSMQPSPPR